GKIALAFLAPRIVVIPAALFAAKPSAVLFLSSLTWAADKERGVAGFTCSGLGTRNRHLRCVIHQRTASRCRSDTHRARATRFIGKVDGEMCDGMLPFDLQPAAISAAKGSLNVLRQKEPVPYAFALRRERALSVEVGT